MGITNHTSDTIVQHQVCDDYTVLESLVFDHFNSTQTPKAELLLNFLLCLTW